MNAHGSHSMAKTALWEVISETNNLFHNFDRIVTACLIMIYILFEWEKSEKIDAELYTRTFD